MQCRLIFFLWKATVLNLFLVIVIILDLDMVWGHGKLGNNGYYVSAIFTARKNSELYSSLL